MLTVAIDGACRRNGKPDCVAAGGAFFIYHSEDGVVDHTMRLSAYEAGSTNQRGEMLALLHTLTLLQNTQEDVRIVTDSEYLFNAMTKGWVNRWVNNGWRTAAGEPVKNADLWELIHDTASVLNVEVNYYHIKGHLLSFGKVTAQKLIEEDVSGLKLHERVYHHFDNQQAFKATAFENAQKLSEQNNGFRLPKNVFKDFVVANTVADIVATQAVEVADREI